MSDSKVPMAHKSGVSGSDKPKIFLDFPSIKSRITMVQVLKHYGVFDTLKVVGKGPHGPLHGPCPIHRGTDKYQFRVDGVKNIWKCFSDSCNKGGNVLDFIAAMERVSVYPAALKACELFGIPISEVTKKR